MKRGKKDDGSGAIVAANYHMAFIDHDAEEAGDEDGSGEVAASSSSSSSSSMPSKELAPRLTFLYRLVPGPASRSYGLNVARMARLPSSLLRVAVERARMMEERLGMVG